ncbi:MAG: hypothetical protein ACRC6K_03290 [Fusobacteriaceae bacterium]
MKKMLLIGVLALGTLTFANSFGTHGRGYKNSEYGHHNNSGYEHQNGTGMMGNTRFGRRTLTREEQQNRIIIQEKRIAIRKLMLNDNVDWKAVEKINLEIAQMQAKNRTVMMKEGYDNYNMMEAEIKKDQN